MKPMTDKISLKFWCVVFVITVLIVAFIGCGGGGTAPSQNSNPQPNTTALQVNLGDAPADRLVAISVTIGSMALTGSSGGTVTMISSATPVEMMHLMGTVQPISLMPVPQGSYSGATVTINSANLMYLNPGTGQLIQKSVQGPMTTNVSLNPALVVGTSPMVLNLDMNMASSVTIDNSGNVGMTPTITASINAAAIGSSHNPENGGMEHMTGTVTGVSGNSFTMSTMQSGQNISVATGPDTQFHGMGGMGGMSNNMIVMVDADMQSDGTFMAQNVESVMPMSSGSMATGLVTATTGNPVTQLTLVMHEGVGSGMMGSDLAGTATVNVTSNATFNIDSDNVDMSNLPFTPTFDGTTLFKGQRIEAISSNGMMSGGGMGGMMGGTTINASEIELEEQGLSGTVSGASGGAPTSFTLTLPNDSAFTTLTGSTTVTVFQQPGTQLWGMGNVSNTSAVHVRGLLFFDAGTYKLVARRIMAP